MNDKVIVESMVSGIVGITLPHLLFSKSWPKKGSKLPIDKEILRQAIYEPGVEYMFKHGILYMDDMDFGEDTKGSSKIGKVILIVVIIVVVAVAGLVVFLKIRKKKKEAKKKERIERRIERE